MAFFSIYLALGHENTEDLVKTATDRDSLEYCWMFLNSA